MWAKLDDRWWSHRKTQAVSLAASGLWARMLSYCAGQASDGFFPGHAMRLMAEQPLESLASLAEELVRAGLLDHAAGGWNMHDYTHYNKTAQEQSQIREARITAGRKGGIISGTSRASNRFNQTRSKPSKHPSNPRPVPSRPVPSRPDGVADPSDPLPPAAGDLPEARANKPRTGGPTVGLWVELMRAVRGVERPTVTQQDAATAYRWASGRPPTEVDLAVRALVADDDAFVVKNGWRLGLLPSRANGYLAKRSRTLTPIADKWAGMAPGIVDLEAEAKP